MNTPGYFECLVTDFLLCVPVTAMVDEKKQQEHLNVIKLYETKITTLYSKTQFKRTHVREDILHSVTNSTNIADKICLITKIVTMFIVYYSISKFLVLHDTIIKDCSIVQLLLGSVIPFWYKVNLIPGSVH